MHTLLIIAQNIGEYSVKFENPYFVLGGEGSVEIFAANQYMQ